MKVLMIYATTDGQTEKIGYLVAERLRAYQLTVEVEVCGTSDA